MCSLLPGDDKLAFSVFWEISPEAEIVSHYFTRSVIRSCAQLAYEHAQVNIIFVRLTKVYPHSLIFQFSSKISLSTNMG